MSNLWNRCRVLCVLPLVFVCVTSIIAQNTDRSARETLWDSYKFPEGKFVRYVDKKHGISFRVPAEWKKDIFSKDRTSFSSKNDTAYLSYIQDAIPEGIGVAPYAASFLQGVRKELALEPESVVMRSVRAGGMEWREISYDLPDNSDTHQTVWITANGAIAHVFIFSSKSNEPAEFEPVFKRVISSISFSSTGHWDEEYEVIREKVVGNNESTSAIESDVNNLVNSLRQIEISQSAGVTQLSKLFSASPDSVIDLITDHDPNIRALAVNAINIGSKSEITDLLLWVLKDKDLFVSNVAAIALKDKLNTASIKKRLPALTEKLSVAVRLILALSESDKRGLMEAMFIGTNAKEHMAALQIVMHSEKFDIQLPLSKLFASSDPGVVYTAIEVIKNHPKSQSIESLLAIIGTKDEIGAIRALGEIAPIEIVSVLDKRILFAKPNSLYLPKSNKVRGKSKSRKQVIESITQTMEPPPPMGGVHWRAANTLYYEPYYHTLRRSETEMAIRKITFRHRWNQAKDRSERLALKAELEKDTYLDRDLIEWANHTLLNRIDIEWEVKFQPQTDFSTTGETVFPKHTEKYVMIPNLKQSIEAIDVAISKIKMPSVKDQMTFLVIQKSIRAMVREALGANAIDVEDATGIDFSSPIAAASWEATDGNSYNSIRNALTVKVTDKARFERVVSDYVETVGDIDYLITSGSYLARYAGIMTTAFPILYQKLGIGIDGKFIPGAVRSGYQSQIPSLKPFVTETKYIFNGVNVTTFSRPIISETGWSRRDAIHIAYFGNSAIVSSSLNTIAEMMKPEGDKLAGSESFIKNRLMKGEIHFLGSAKEIFKDIPFLYDSNPKEKELNDIVDAFGTEHGVLKLNGNSFDTILNIDVKENVIAKYFKIFNAESLTIPQKILPASSMLYIGSILNTESIKQAIKALTINDNNKNSASNELRNDIEKVIFPNIEGEVGGALLGISPRSKTGLLPPFAVIIKLNSAEPSIAFRAGKLFKQFTRIPNITALGSPIISSGATAELFTSITENYLIIADSLETMQLFELKEKLALTDGYKKSVRNLPSNTALFISYNPETLYTDMSKMSSDTTFQIGLSMMKTMSQAFYGTHAYVALEKSVVSGLMSVSFDKEGKYSIKDAANSVEEKDFTNITIMPKGLVVLDSTKIESMTLRIAGKDMGIGHRLKEDFTSYDYQKIDSIDNSSITVNSSARHIPEKLTIKLPVTGNEFKPYLESDFSISTTDWSIQAKAKEIIGNDNDGRSVVRKIAEWTHKNLKWKMVESDAAQTLATREADCMEHSELYVALARSVGLPARVVMGIAMADGSFGGHAWVEVYLGKWVELDPTWGLSDHVDATHLRFDGGSMFSYLILDKLDIEVKSVHRAIADFQRDPVRLVKEFATNEDNIEAPFDLTLTAERVFGREGLATLNDKQRSIVATAFTKTVNDIVDDWKSAIAYNSIHILHSDIKSGTAFITLMRGVYFIRLTLAKHDGAWYIVEQEDLDNPWALFTDSLRGAVRPDQKRNYALSAPIELAHKHVDKLIVAEGETAELMFLKAKIMEREQSKKIFEDLEKEPDNKTLKNGEVKTGEKKAKAFNHHLDYLKKIVTKYPNFAQAKYVLTGNLYSSIYIDENTDINSGEAQLFLKELSAYQNIVPYDARSLIRLAGFYEHFKKYDDALAIYEKAISILPDEQLYHYSLIEFLVKQKMLDNAVPALARMFKLSDKAETIFEYFDNEGEDIEKEYAASLESLFLKFPKELDKTYYGYYLLSTLQQTQEKYNDAIKSLQRSIAIEPRAYTYNNLSAIYRKMKKYDDALKASDAAIKLDAENSDLHFGRAAALANLNRKKEAIDSLKYLLEKSKFSDYLLDNDELIPLADLPEFKAMLEAKEKRAKEAEKEQ